MKLVWELGGLTVVVGVVLSVLAGDGLSIVAGADQLGGLLAHAGGHLLQWGCEFTGVHDGWLGGGGLRGWVTVDHTVDTLADVRDLAELFDGLTAKRDDDVLDLLADTVHVLVEFAFGVPCGGDGLGLQLGDTLA